jgi:hypothetical protein
MNASLRTLAAVAAPLACVLPLLGQQVPDRATLNALLGNARTVEAFEAWVPLSPGLQAILGPVANRSSVIGTQGPGLLAAGCSYRGIGGNVIWPTAGGSSTLTSNGLSISFAATSMIIEYDVPVPAVGFDVLWAQLLLGSGRCTVTFRDASANALGSLVISAAVPGQVSFAGWQDAGGIASVELVSAISIQQMVIDNHTYGLDSQLASDKESFGAGCNTTYASFYEGTNNFDLSNTSLSFTNTGTTYRVIPGSDLPLPVTGTPTPINSTVVTFPLNWTFPFPGGSTDRLFIGRMGFVRFRQSAFGNSSLFTNGPAVAAKQSSYNFGQGGSVYLETDPVAQTAKVTFLQVGELNTSGTNTFQYLFDAQGRIEMRFGSCVPGPALTGWSPGANNLDPGSMDISAATVIMPSDRDRQPLAIATAGFPIIGSNLPLVITRVPPGSLATFHVLGLTAFQPGLNLSSVGMPTCMAYSSIDFSHLAVNPPGASVTYGLAIPNQPNLVGLELFAQGFALDPAGGHNPFGGLTSNGLRLLIGGF